MIRHFFNWKTVLLFIAILIVSGTIVYSQYVAKQIAIEERKNVAAWVEAERTILNADANSNINLASKISSENKEIPIIETDEKNIPTGNFINIDTIKVKSDSNYLKQKLAAFITYNKEPIILVLTQNPYTINKYYYGESKLLKEVKWYPFVQLLVVALFVLIAFTSW